MTASREGDHVVQELPWRWGVQGKIFIIGGLGFMFDGWDVSITGYLMPLLAKQFGLDKPELAFFATAGLAGMAVGAFAWGTVADVLGRKRAFSLTLLIFAVLSVLGAASPNYEILLLTRFLAGIGLGGCVAVDYAMIAEFTPRAVRGRVLAALDVWWPIGATLCGLVSASLLSVGSWRMLLMVMVLPALLVFWVRRSIPESPLYLVRKGRTDEARAVITDLIARTGAEVGEWTLPRPRVAPREKVSVVLTKLRAIWAYDWKVTLAAWATFTVVLIEYYGALVWLPTILKANKQGDMAAFLTTTGMTAIGIVGVLVSAWLVEAVGRKWVIIVSALVSAVTLVLFAAMLGVPVVAQAWILVFGFAIELAIPSMQTYLPELYPTLLRATGFGWASAASRVGAALVPVIFGTWLWPLLGLTNTFLVTGAVLLVAMVWLIVVGPETRGRQLDEADALDEPTTVPLS
jgi:MFS transporter, putative metabolite:H+ symporter